MIVSIYTTMTNNRQEIETKYRHESTNREECELQNNGQTQKKQSKRHVRSSGDPRTQIKFRSVLTRPFSLWNEIDDIVGAFLTYLDISHRNKAIKSLIRFLELKVIMEEYTTNGLLSPTEAVAHVWQVLILETELYRKTLKAIQDFHARPHRYIHHALCRNCNTNAYQERVERTQRLFKTYYRTKMPTAFRAKSIKQNNPISADLPTSVRIDTASLVSESIDEFTLDDQEGFLSWYTPWLPGCNCFGAFENSLCCNEKKYEDLYPHGLSNE